MSLINQMLRDLEQRRREDGGGPGRVRPVGADTGGGWRWLLLALVVAALMGLSAYLVMSDRLSSGDLPETQSAPPAEAEPPLELDLAVAAEPEPTRLVAIEQVTRRDGERLRLDFDGDSAYRRRPAADDRLVLEVDAVLAEGLRDALPPAVASVDEAPQEDSLRLSLGLDEAWQAGALYLEQAPGGGDRLLLVLRPAEPSPDETTAEQDPPDSPAETATESPAESASEPISDEADTARETDEAEARETEAETTPGMTRERRTRTDAERASRAWGEAREALRAGRLAEGERHLRQVLSLQATHIQARETLAELLADTGRIEAADRLLADTLELPQLPAVELGYFARQRARLWLAQERPRRGIEALEAVYPARDDAVESAALLAGLYYREQDYAQAASHYEQLVAQDSEQGAWWMGLGLAREGLGNHQAAVAAYRNALAGDGLGPSVRDYLRQRVDELSTGESGQ